MEAAKTQHTMVPGQDVAASIVADLATQILALDERIHDLEARISATFRAHPQAEIIESMPGIGTILGAELVAAAGDLSAVSQRWPARLSRWAGPGPTGLRPPHREPAPSEAVLTASCAGCSTCPRRRP